MKYKVYAIKQLSTGEYYKGGFLGFGNQRCFTNGDIREAKFYKYRKHAISLFTSDGEYPMDDKEYKVVELEITINEINKENINEKNQLRKGE